MSTVATSPLRKLADQWENECGLKSAVLSGIVGDKSHAARGGYHISRGDNPAGNYSITRPDDRAGNGPNDAAAAIDMTMSTADMKSCTTRLLAIYNDKSHPARKYVNAFNGWLGSGDASRWDVYAGTKKYATADHKWHVHLEIRRKYVNDSTALGVILAALKGTPVVAAKPAAPVKVPAYPGRILRRNDKQSKPDAALKLWQQRMIARGWSKLGTADGFFGATTQEVVRQFQQQCKVPVDGEIGPKTWPLPWTARIT